jgi:peptidoglycan/xylan/chitin deacetylase (PgdA/CDA1 family)
VQSIVDTDASIARIIGYGVKQMKTLRTWFLSAALIGASALPSFAGACPNPGAIGPSRTVEVNPIDYPLVGKVQYMETLRLKDREVVLTFDDGPMVNGTDKILDELARHCVHATFFLVGVHAVESPALAKRVHDEGHTVGFHSFSHPDVKKIPHDQARSDINKGIAAVRDALGKSRSAAPFYRPPYLSMTKELERYLNSRGIMIWSIDADSEDWVPASDQALLDRIIDRLERAGKGILLLHDIQPITVRILPRLLNELKARDFRIVHVVPATGKTASAAQASAPN